MGLVQSTQITFQHSNTVRFQSTQFNHSHSISNFHEVKLYFYYRINTETIFALFIVFSFNWQCVQHVLLLCTQNYTCYFSRKVCNLPFAKQDIMWIQRNLVNILGFLFCFVLFRSSVRYPILLHLKKEQCL